MSKQIVIIPGGFHPFHAGHAALYKSAIAAFNNADTYVAATNDTKTRPFPFAIKEKLARLAGVADKHFVQVKSPFQPIEITGHYNPEEDVLIFVRSEKDRNESPKPGGTKKDGTPAYFQPWTGKDVQPFGQHAYMAYLPTVEFGPGITSATEIRNAWPTLNDKRRTAMVMSLYPVTQKNPKLAANVVKMLDMGMGNELSEGSLNEFVPPSSDGGGENDRSRRIRKLLEIAIQVAKEKNVDELGMIHAMNMIAGDDFFSVAVEGILPDITDKEYMFVLQSAYKTVKQGLAEGLKHTLRKFDPTIKARILAKSQDQTDQGLDTIAQLADMGLTSDDMISRAMKPNTYFKNAERYAKLLAKKGVAEAEKTAKVFHPQYVDVYYLDGPRRTPLLVNRKVPYKLIDRYLEVVIKKYNLQQGRFEFRNAEEDPIKVTESVDYLEEK